MRCGDRIRLTQTTDAIDAAGLGMWLREHAAVDVSEVTRRTWLTMDWSSSGKLLSIVEVEHSIGSRLHLPVHAASFSAAGADALAVSLLDGSASSACVRVLLLGTVSASVQA